MNESDYGTEDATGAWSPKKKISYGPLFKWPPQPWALFKFIFGVPGYLFPMNCLYALLAVVIWRYLTPSMDVMGTFSIDWILVVFGRNLVLMVIFVGLIHFWLYVKRAQGNTFKYNRQWPKKESSAFLFKNQTADNIFWSLASGVPIWTAYEVVLLWCYANGIMPSISYAENPVFFFVLLLLVPVIHEAGFFFAHRLLHWPPLFRIAHRTHHLNTNPGPWSGLSMHPIEHLLYFSSVLLFFIIPSHPIHMINLLSRLGIAPAQGHTGFDRIAIGKNKSVDSSYYAHYLHHKYFEVNYADGMIPLDKWFGSFHDGSPEAHQKMLDRRGRR